MQELEKSIRYVKGVGQRLSELLSKKHIRTIEDALFFFPRDYEDRRKILNVSKAEVCEQANVIGRIRRAYPVSYTRSRRQAFDVILEDLEDPFSEIVLKWFRRPYAYQRFDAGQILMATGKLQTYRGRLQMAHPDIEFLGKNLEPNSQQRAVLPVYSQTEGLYQKTIRKIERSVAKQYSGLLEEFLPLSILESRKLMGRSQAVYELHCPDDSVDFELLKELRTEAHRRMIYEEFFLLSVILGSNRRSYVEKVGIGFQKPKKMWQGLAQNLPFKFTAAQKRVLQEVLEDMTREGVMYRMIQGDVGSGKTVVAASAGLVALESGYQVALMAPTEVLVRQHYEKFREWYEDLGVECVLLTGSMKSAEKKAVLQRLKDNESLIAFGTHALFEDQVVFKKLGLVIVDEQHRFGVRQRARLISKGNNPDVLVMTATPIPRTLALTVYGDLDVSIIDELPPGRKPIKTKLILEKARASLVREVRKELEAGRQAYMVFPLIEESEKLSLKSIEQLWPQLEQEYSGFRMAKLHGRMESEEKNNILDEFRRGELDILVSTTVVEVGVDVPNASIMIVENAERFGLSQIHQLRGRVGRGENASFCYLLPSHLGSREVIRRLRALEKTQDGFKLAEIDLEMRGPGEFVGTKQSGLPDFRVAQLPRHLQILQMAREDAFKLLERDPDLETEPQLKSYLERRFEDFHPS